MGKPGKWFRSFWTTGKKDQTKKSPNPIPSDPQTQTQIQNPNPPTPKSGTPTKEKKRWSFRRSSATATATAAAGSPTKDPIPAAATAAASVPPAAAPPPEPEEKQPVLPEAAAVAEEVEAEAETEVAAPVDDGGGNAVYLAILEEAAAVKIQSVFRSYLARKALKALRGLVKLQALVRGHLVRKQATATLRCMQALVTAQARARAQRVRSVDDLKMMSSNPRNSTHRRPSHDKIKHSYHDMEENIKIVEMDHGEYYKSSRNSYSTSSSQHPQISDRTDDKISTYYSSQRAYTNPTKVLDQIQQQISPAPSGITDLSPRTCSGHFEEYYSYASSPQCHSQPPQFSFPRPDFLGEAASSYEFPLYPNYMANTQSSRAKARSQSAPKQRPDFERQPSRGRRPSVEGRGIPKGGARMQRSSSHVGSTTGQQLPLQYPWSVKLDKSTVSLVDSECGSNCSVFTTNGNYPRSVVSYDPRY